MHNDELLAVFKNLSDENRFNIFLLLVGEGELSVGDISARTGLSQPLTSHHLRHLREVGLLNCRRDGNSILYSACGEKLKWFCGTIHDELQSRYQKVCGE
jgi:ArsR family transcriptional regulator, lead/cadmium/zinc/bismuth-responsive transcriptional repressor